MPVHPSRWLRYARRIPSRLSRSSDPRIQRAYTTGRHLVRRTVNTVTPLQLGWVGNLHAARWLPDGRFELSGWAFERGHGYTDTPPTVRVRLTALGVPPVEAEVENYDEPLANSRLSAAMDDYTKSGFVARFDPAALWALGRPKRWTVEILISSEGHRAKGTLTRRTSLSSAYYLFPRTFEDGVQALPEWDDRNGLQFRVGRPRVRVENARLDGREVSLEVVCAGPEFASAELRSVQGVTPLRATAVAPGRYRLAGTLPPVDPAGPSGITEAGEDEGRYTPEVGDVLPVISHFVVVTDTRGHEHTARSTIDPLAPVAWPATPPLADTGEGGVFRLWDTEAMLVVTAVSIEHEPVPGVRVSGVVLGDLAEPQLTLVGGRARRSMSIEVRPDRTFEAYGSWLASAWGRRGVPPMSGRYTLRGQRPDGTWFRVAADAGVIAQAPQRDVLDLFTCHLGVAEGRRLACTLSASQTASEFGSFNQGRLRELYTSSSMQGRHQFYFESFGGKQANCNPFALDREVAARFPDVPRYWGVIDAAVAVPEGAIPVVRGTEAWWEARQTSKYVITNEWLQRSFQRMPYQVVLQTWHGSMFKRIGLDRPSTDIVMRRALLKERSNWDVLLSQNPHSSEIFKSAYDWKRPIWEEGYPRNDLLLTAPREPMRRQLGIPEDKIAVLYAPTWREDRAEMVTFLDLERLVADLGDDYVLLLRGHSRTMEAGADVILPGIIDVTSYPDITDLFLAADAMITDYSSVMFDFSVTGRPMLFFVPDIEEYRDSLRGVYFDLAPVAPGPLLSTQDEVGAAILAMQAEAPRYAEAYRAWQQRFNPYDDGHSAERVIDRLLARG